MKKLIALFLIMIFSLSLLSLAAEEGKVKIKGQINEIAEDGSYIKVEGQKVVTTKELVEEAYFEIGDKVEIEVENSPKGLQLLNYQYIFEEELEQDEGSGLTFPEEGYD